MIVGGREMKERECVRVRERERAKEGGRYAEGET